MHWASMLSNRPMNASDLRGGQEDNFQPTRGREGEDELPTLATSYITRYQGEWGTHVWASQHTRKQKMLACTRMKQLPASPSGRPPRRRGRGGVHAWMPLTLLHTNTNTKHLDAAARVSSKYASSAATRSITRLNTGITALA